MIIDKFTKRVFYVNNKVCFCELSEIVWNLIILNQLINWLIK